MNKLIETIDTYVKKVPSLPTNLKEMLVKFAPWAAIITVVLAIPTIISFLGIGSYMNIYGYSYIGRHFGARYLLLIIFLATNVILKGLSISPLFSKSIKGWNLFFYSTLLYFVYSIITFDIVGGLISTLISIYLLFQVKEYYK